MRITHGIIYRNFLRNLDNVTNNLNKEFEQISSGKRILRPSDDPVSIRTTLNLKEGLKRIEQYERNIDNAISWLNMTESALSDMENVINRLEEITISMGSDNVSSSERKIAAEEVKQIRSHALMIVNTRFKGRYIFAGFKTDTPPFVEKNGSIIYQGGNESIEVEVDNGIKTSYNLTGSLFTDQVNIFQLMDNLIDSLNNNDPNAIRSLLDDIHTAYNKINIAHSNIGAKTKTLNNMKEDFSKRKLLFEDIISKKEDADMAKAISKLYIYQSGYQALLNSFAKITSVNLFNYIG